ncbi:uncharacterized protein LOC109056913 isoform X6 [Cyprinus carpio]|uniref:Uncharacterized protein LOC109056913 isoform X6 n=1 Tax=Cyprinus carpio TaxID=7962 RepID=A0A9Q9Y3E3_CYPCA|nr:uncharacterized protein LOC109056913 isoform X6 [Cyprinus carpio]
MNQYQVQEYEPFEPVQGKYYVIEMGKSGNLQKKVLGHLHKQRPYLEEVRSVEDCNVILVFCPIVSRAGTDIDAALNKLNTCSASKPAILMVFHHSFDPDKIVPDSSRFINRGNTLTVDCLFFEDVGLLTCNRNEDALAKIVQCFKYQKHIPEIVQKYFSYMWNIFTKYLYPGYCWILGTVRNNERSRLIDADGEKTA